MILLLLACAGDKTVLFDTGSSSVDSDETSETGDAGDDEGLGALSAAPVWTGAHDGYGTGLVWADLDADGDGDLVVSFGNDMDPGVLGVYWNQDGALTESPHPLTEEPAYYAHLSAGDMDGDGLVDLVASRYLGEGRFSEPGGVQVWLNTGATLSLGWELAGTYSFSNALGDVDRDGDLDLAVASGESYRNDPERSSLFLNDGRGDLGDEPAWTTEAPRYSLDVAFADLDGDSWLDLAFANQLSGHTIYLNDGAGHLGDAPAWTADGDDADFEGNTLDWGDVNGDGALDLAVSDNDQQGGLGAFRLWCGPTFALCWSAEDAPTYPSALSLADADGDGDLDLTTGSWWGSVRTYENGGGALAGTATWQGDPEHVVVEAFGWEDVDGADSHDETLTGEGIVVIPGRARALSVTGGVAGDGYATGPGALTVTVRASAVRDLAVTDWEPEGRELLFGRSD